MADPREIAEATHWANEILAGMPVPMHEGQIVARAFLAQERCPPGCPKCAAAYLDRKELEERLAAQQPVIDAARRVAATYNEDDLSYLGDTLHRLDAAAAPPEAT
jgi:hypothetical protein